MSNDHVRLIEMDGVGNEVRSTVINPARCPHFILTPRHYRTDGSCKCDDSNETVMKSWGYRWSKKDGRWK